MAGANIRCPSCAHVFFVGGPSGSNVVDESADTSAAALPTMGRTQSLPAADPSRIRRSPATDSSLGSRDGEPSPQATAPPVAPPAPEPAAAHQTPFPPNPEASAAAAERLAPGRHAATPLPQPSPDPASSDLGSASVASPPSESEYEAAVRAALSGIVPPGASSDAPAPAAPSATTTGSRPAAPAEPAPRPAPKLAQLHKVRADSGIIYDFHDMPAVRKWLSTRATFDDLKVSADGGETWNVVSDVPELSDVKPTGNKPRTGSLPAIAPDPRTTTQPGIKLPATGPTPAVPPPSRTTGSVATVPPNATGSVDAAATRTASRAAVGEGKDKDKDGDAKKKKGIPAWRAGLYVAVVTGTALAGAVFLGEEDRGPQIPDTPAGDHLRWVMSNISGGSSALNQAAIDARFEAEAAAQVGTAVIERLQFLDEWRAQYVITSFVGTSSNDWLVTSVQTEGGDQGYIVIGTEPAPPHRINVFQVGNGQPPPRFIR